MLSRTVSASCVRMCELRSCCDPCSFTLLKHHPCVCLLPHKYMLTLCCACTLHAHVTAVLSCSATSIMQHDI